MIWRILTETPIWVFALLAFLVWQGVRALGDCAMPLWRVLIVPMVFLVIGLARLAFLPSGVLTPLAAWLAAATAFALLGYAGGPKVLAAEAKRVTLQGSPVPLTRNLIMFVLQCALAVTAAMRLGDQDTLRLFSFAVAGASAGYFAGWLTSLSRQYRAVAPRSPVNVRAIAVRVVAAALAGVGVVSLVLLAMIATPLKHPPELTSISDTVRTVDRSTMPPLDRFQARDGTFLAFRHYAPAGVPRAEIAVLIHGSSGSSVAIHPVGHALADRGVETFAIDMRGHGGSGARGDIAYPGQLDDDLADLVAFIRAKHPSDPIALIGHSSGGGFALRIAGSPLQVQFSQTILLAPYLGWNAPTSRPNAGGWASPDIPRILALRVLDRFGIRCCEGLPVLAFAVPPNAQRFVTATYSDRLMRNFATADFAADIAHAKKPLTIISGAEDELMVADRYEAVRGRLPIAVKLIAGVNHMAVVSDSKALDAIAETVMANGGGS